MRKAIGLAAVVMLFAAGAQAQETNRWSILGADTLPTGSDAISGSFGWPDVTFGYKHGVNDKFDAGVNFSILYGVENRTDTQFGLAASVPLRFKLLERGKVSMALHIDPGVRLYTTSPAFFGFQFPIGVNFAVRVMPDLIVGAGADFWSSLFVTGPLAPNYWFGPLIGPYVEYHIDPQLVIGLNLRFGAIIDAFSGQDIAGFGHVDGGTETGFGFQAQAVFAYKL